MNVIVAAVLGVVSIITLLGVSVAAVGNLNVDSHQMYGETMKVIDGDPNSVQQSSSNDTSLLQPAAKSE